MKKHDLLLTLGHNSSAILVDSSPNARCKIVCGYEQERLSQKKSDSMFPLAAIRRCMQVAGIDAVDKIYATHWSPDGQIDSMSKKHWDRDHLPNFNNLITHQNSGLTHHDTHARAASWYAFSKPGLNPQNTMMFVIDGFGNYGEHISIYKIDATKQPKLIRRFFGYGGSLGLMYQYMTGFLGMKQHEDEYKILGYEVHIHNVDIDLQLLHKEINKEVTRLLDGYFDSKSLVDAYDPLIRLDALPALQVNMIERWSKLMKLFNLDDPKSFEARVVMGYFVQAVLEGVVLTLVKIYNPVNLIVTGGVFYNVKLNRRLISAIPGKLCAFPLAGDQGNALGLYVDENDLEWPGHLLWGVRPKVMDAQKRDLPAGLQYYTSAEEAVYEMIDHIEHRGMVNVVRGAMEFGPRALCNTSTIAAPSPAIVNRINRMNGRNTVMPMAPVMNRSEYLARMELTDKVHLSEEHMIVALPYKPGAAESCLGAAHPYPDEFTGRPQVLDGDKVMDSLFSYRPVLINTSFNVHGRPIAYSFDDVIDNHVHERKQEPITTIYIEGENQ